MKGPDRNINDTSLAFGYKKIKVLEINSGKKGQNELFYQFGPI